MGITNQLTQPDRFTLRKKVPLSTRGIGGAERKEKSVCVQGSNPRLYCTASYAPYSDVLVAIGMNV